MPAWRARFLIASVSGTSSITISGMVPPGAGALVSVTVVVAAAVASAGGAFVVAASVAGVVLAGALVVLAGSACAVLSAAGALVALAASAGAVLATAGALVAAAGSVAAGWAVSLVVVTLALVLWSSAAGGLSWALAAKLQATSPTSVTRHSFSFICIYICSDVPIPTGLLSIIATVF